MHNTVNSLTEICRRISASVQAILPCNFTAWSTFAYVEFKSADEHKKYKYNKNAVLYMDIKVSYYVL